MPQVGAPVPLSLQLFDGNTVQFIRARVFDPAGAEISGSPFALAHVAGGLYQPSSYPAMPDVAFLRAQYQVFSDAGFTTENTDYSMAKDVFERSLSALQIWEEATSSHTGAGTLGAALGTTASRVDLTLSTRASQSSITSLSTQVGTRASQASVDALDTKIGMPESGTIAEDLANIAGVANQYKVKSTASVDPVTDILTVVAWLEQNGQLVTDSDYAVVEVYNAAGADIQTDLPQVSAANPVGAFTIQVPQASTFLAANKSYIVLVYISHTAGCFYAPQSFTTF